MRRVSQNKSPLKGAGIPPYVPDKVHSMKIRYSPNSLSLSSFTLELPIAPFGIARNTTTLVCPFKAVRLAGFKMWCNYVPGTTIVNNTISATCAARRTVRPIEWADTASYDHTAYIRKKFSPVEPLGLWYITASGETNPDLTFELPQGGILELDLRFILSDGVAGPESVPGSSLTTGFLYTNQLSTSLLPLSRVDYKVIQI